MRILESFGDDETPHMQTSVISFGYKHGIPLDVDLVFDCRFLPNPFWVEELGHTAGSTTRSANTCSASPSRSTSSRRSTTCLTSILPAFAREGKSYLTIAMGCTGGRHRSVVLAEALAARLGRMGRRVGLPPGHRPVSGARPAVVAIGGGHGTAVTLRRPGATPRADRDRLGGRRRRQQRPPP